MATYSVGDKHSTTIDEISAYIWFCMAAESGDAKAAQLRDTVEKRRAGMGSSAF